MLSTARSALAPPASDPVKPVRSAEEFLIFGAPLICDEEENEILSSLRSGWLGTGPKVARLEREFRDYKGAPYAVAVNSCTAALHLSMLAAGIGIATVASGDLYSQTEGQYAGAAREMIQSQHWLLPTNDGIPRLQKPPLLYWLIIISFKLFGVNAPAARLPVALAVVVSAALVFLIAEKLTNYWRGFIAGLIFLSFCGTFLLARIVMPEPLVMALTAGAIYCGVRGYQRRQHRHLWFAGFWLCCA